jgi:hypothetical protein
MGVLFGCMDDWLPRLPDILGRVFIPFGIVVVAGAAATVFPPLMMLPLLYVPEEV